MRTIKIVADSSANLLALENVNFGTAPLKITTTQRYIHVDSTTALEGVNRLQKPQNP